MRKFLLITTLGVATTSSVFGLNNNLFQEFDNQFNAGYSVSQFQLSNGGGQQALQQNQALGLEVERLFDAGIWMDVNTSLVMSTNSLGNQSKGTGMTYAQPVSQVPALGGVNAKVGYAFPLSGQNLQVIPYALAGYNTNLAMSTLTSNNFANVTNDVFWTAGLGARVEYRINEYVQLYADQNGVYNWDQSGPLNGIMPQNNMVYTTTIGAKFKPYKSLILGINGFYNNYQYMATPPGSGSTSGGNNSSTGGSYTIYQPQSSFGGMVTVGLTY